MCGLGGVCMYTYVPCWIGVHLRSAVKHSTQDVFFCFELNYSVTRNYLNFNENNLHNASKSSTKFCLSFFFDKFFFDKFLHG